MLVNLYFVRPDNFNPALLPTIEGVSTPLNQLSDNEIHTLMARLEEEAYHRLGVLVGKLED